MSRDEQYSFIGSVLSGLNLEIFQKIEAGKIPEEWDGHELRQYMVDKLHERFSMGGKMSPKRMKDYENSVMIENL